MSHGSYDSNLGPKRLILVGDIRSKSCPTIGDAYGTIIMLLSKYLYCHVDSLQPFVLKLKKKGGTSKVLVVNSDDDVEKQDLSGSTPTVWPKPILIKVPGW